MYLAHTFSLFSVSGSDFAVNVESSIPPGENLLHNRAKIAILPLKAGLILQEELLKIMEKHPVENAALWMTLTVNPCHGKDEDSKSGPIQRRMTQRLLIPWKGLL